MTIINRMNVFSDFVAEAEEGVKILNGYDGQTGRFVYPVIVTARRELYEGCPGVRIIPGNSLQLDQLGRAMALLDSEHVQIVQLTLDDADVLDKLDASFLKKALRVFYVETEYQKLLVAFYATEGGTRPANAVVYKLVVHTTTDITGAQVPYRQSWEKHPIHDYLTGKIAEFNAAAATKGFKPISVVLNKYELLAYMVSGLTLVAHVPRRLGANNKPMADEEMRHFFLDGPRPQIRFLYGAYEAQVKHLERLARSMAEVARDVRTGQAAGAAFTSYFPPANPSDEYPF